MPDVSPYDRDLLIRTIIGEAGNEDDVGRAAVAHVIMNRVNSGQYGATPGKVVLSKGQFEPWSTRSKELLSIPENDPQYINAAHIADQVLGGQIKDPTGGATHFLNPDIVKTRTGGTLPDWAQGQGVQIGDHTFYKPGQGGQDAVAQNFGLGKTRSVQPNNAQNTALSYTDDDLMKSFLQGAPFPGTNSLTPEDNDVLNAFKGGAHPDVAVKRAADLKDYKPGVMGLVWGKDGGRDPKTGELVVAGKPPDSGAHWSSLVNFMNAVTLGAGPKIMGAAGAARDVISQEIPPSQFGNVASQGEKAYSDARTQYAQDNPLTAVATDIGGSTLTTLPLMASGAGAIGAGVNKLTTAMQNGPAAVRAVAPAVEGVANFVAGNAKGNPFTRVGSIATRGAVEGAASGGLNSGLGEGSVGDQAGAGALLGAGWAPVGAAAVRAGAGLANALFGTKTNPNVARLASTAINKYGIPLGGGQVTTSPAMKFLDSVTQRMPFSGAATAADARQVAFNRAVGETIGERGAERITPDVMSAAKNRIGKVFDSVASRTPIILFDTGFANDVSKILREADQVLNAEQFSKIYKQTVNLMDKIQPTPAHIGQGNMITGDVYQTFTHKGGPLDQLVSSADPDVRRFASQFRGALDNMLERSAPQDVLDDLRRARGQWKNMKTIEDIVEKEGGKTGNVNPALLQGRVRATYGNTAYGGGGDLKELADIGQQFLKEAPSSGTSERMWWQDTLKFGGTGLAAAVGVGEPQIGAAALGTTAAAIAASRAARLYIDSTAAARRLAAGGMPGSTANRLGADIEQGVRRILPMLPREAPLLARPSPGGNEPR